MLVSCGQSNEERKRLSREEQRRLARQDSLALKIATTPTMDCLPLFLACEDSSFYKNGVDVHLRLCRSQLDGDTLVAGHHVEGLVTDLIRAERLIKQGQLLRYVTATPAYWQLISNRKARISKISQLSEKMIAMTRYSATDYLADLAVDSAKPKYQVFRIQINDVDVRLKMLLNNEMDAMLLPEPQATAARQLKHPVLMDSRDKNLNFGVIAFREEILKNKTRHEQVERFISTYNQQCDSINKNGIRHYAEIIRKYMFVDDRTISKLPNIKFQHAQSPRERDVNIARRKWR